MSNTNINSRQLWRDYTTLIDPIKFGNGTDTALKRAVFSGSALTSSARAGHQSDRYTVTQSCSKLLPCLPVCVCCYDLPLTSALVEPLNCQISAPERQIIPWMCCNLQIIKMSAARMTNFLDIIHRLSLIKKHATFRRLRRQVRKGHLLCWAQHIELVPISLCQQLLLR
jgi:hypothetical protein